ncbi:MAG: glycosyltransferase [Candidatus Abyssubacteria bacterium]
MGIGAILFCLSLAYLLFLVAGYGITLRYLTRGKTLARVDQTPPVTVVVPAFNEEKNISRKIEDLLALEYPSDKLEILIVNNSSDDRTREIAESYPVKVLDSTRGKINAINEGVRHAQSEIVAVTDADTLLNRDAIGSIVTCFASDTIGAVGGKAVVRDTRSFFGKSKMKYHESDWELRVLEGILDSTISLDGKLMAFRKSLLPEIPANAVVDDLEVTLRLRSRGFRVVIDDKALVYETGPQSFTSELKQIRRRVALTIPTLFLYIHMLLNPRYGWFGLFVYPVRRMFAVFSPLMYLYVVGYLIWWNWKIAAALGVIGLPLIVLTGQYFPVIQQYGIILGWLDVLTLKVRESAQWDKVT